MLGNFTFTPVPRLPCFLKIHLLNLPPFIRVMEQLLYYGIDGFQLDFSEYAVEAGVELSPSAIPSDIELLANLTRRFAYCELLPIAG